MENVLQRLPFVPGLMFQEEVLGIKENLIYVFIHSLFKVDLDVTVQ